MSFHKKASLSARVNFNSDEKKVVEMRKTSTNLIGKHYLGIPNVHGRLKEPKEISNHGNYKDVYSFYQHQDQITDDETLKKGMTVSH